MTAFTKDQEYYIQDEQFKILEKRFDHLDNKLNLIIGIVLSSVVLPVGFHLLKLI